MKRPYLLRLLLLLSVLLIGAGEVLVYAQDWGNGGGRPGGPPGGERQRPSIKGQVVNEDGDAVPYAAVVLVDQESQEQVKGAATDMEGRFELNHRPGSYDLLVSFLSYEPLQMKGVKMTPAGTDLGQIVLKSSGLQLEEQVVVAEKSSLSLQLDKRVFNVGKDLSARGGNASDILDNVPSVDVDVEGNVSLRGSQNVRILIDGKPSGLVGDGGEALRQLQGNLVESVEVVTNPSAKYEAEGEAGIINIVLKKEREKGVNGSFDVTTGWPHDHGVAYNLNYRRGKVNLFSSYGFSYRKFVGGGEGFQRFLNDDGLAYQITNRDRRHERGGLGNTVRLGADFFINDQNTISVSGLFKTRRGDNLSTVAYSDIFGDPSFNFEELRTDKEIEEKVDVEANVNYVKTFKQKGRKWTVDAKWLVKDDTERSNIFESSTLLDVADLYQRYDNVEDEQIFLLQTDYTHPFAHGIRLEAGLRSNWRFINNDFTVEEQNELGAWDALDEFDDQFLYDEIIHAAYVTLGRKVDKWSYQAGLRVEQSNITTELVDENYEKARNYTNYFPSVHLAYELQNKNTLQWSYSMRISRPSHWSLLPFFTFADDRNIMSGNPDLEPEYTNSFELGHLKYWEKGSLLSSIYYRYRTGVTERIVIDNLDGTTLRFPINMSTQHAVGLEFSFNYKITNWWKVNGGLNLYRAITDGEYEGEQYFSDTYSVNGNAATKFTLFKSWDAQLSIRYRGPNISTQGRRLSSYGVNCGLSKDVLKGKGTLTFSGQDLFNTRKRRSITDLPNLYSEEEFQWRSRTFRLNFNYRLNQQKKRGRGGRSGSFDGDGGDF